MAQTELEVVRFGDMIRRVKAGDVQDLSQLRRRFDLFYSRINTLRESPLYRELREDELIQDGLSQAQLFLQRYTPIIDGGDAELRQNLTSMDQSLTELREDIREMVIQAVRIFARKADSQREDLSMTLMRLAVWMTALIGALFVAITVLYRMFRRGLRVSRESQQVQSRLEAMVTSALDAILMMDRDGRIVEMNDAATTIFGYARHEAIGKLMAPLFVPPDLREAHGAGMRNYLSSGETRVIGAGRVQLTGMRKSGALFPVEMSLSTAMHEDREVFIAYIRDISARLQAEDDLRRARDQAQAGERAKSNLLTVMSHEMRTPLNGILGAIDLFERDNLTKRQIRLLDAIRVSGDLLLHHVNDVLDLSRLDAGADAPVLSTFDLAEQVTALVESQSASARSRGNSLELVIFDAARGPVLGDARRVQQCLLNLIGNAIKFTRDGEITVEIERLGESEMVEFRIVDTGIGIAEEDLERIFGEFVTVDSSFARESEGTGLGLAITHRLARSMGGEIDADSIEGEGSLFRLTIPLPRSEAQPSQAGQPLVPADAAHAEGCRILVVEDNEINRFLVVEMLQGGGCEVDEAENGLDGVRLAEARDYDLIVMDISMPEMDGMEATRRIRSGDGASAKVPIIALTAHISQADHAKFRRAGFDEILTKPVTRDKLRGVIAHFVLGQEPEAQTEAEDQDTVREFIDMLGEEKYRQTRATFLRSVAELLERVKAGDEDVRALAHREAGSASMLGMLRFLNALRDLENLPDGADPEPIAARLRGLLDAAEAEDAP
jgi:PAS domain S-box-containing protein